MKKHIFSLLAFSFVALLSWAGNVTSPAEIPAYWASVDGKSGATLWSAVSAATAKGYSSLGYAGLYSAYLKTDVYPADSVGKAGKIWDMYGECVFSSGNTCGNYSGVCDCYNREHSIPQSWWGGGTSGIGNDIFHVLPTDGKINGVRSNYEYGVVNGGTNWVGNKYGPAGSWATDRKTIASAAGESVNGSGNVFEPKDQYKGDWARGILGTIVKWQEDLTTSNNFFSDAYNAANYYGLTKKAVVLLMKWHREDPVSQKEIDRNNGIQQTQGNRNPFIDYPYLAEYIWGEHAGETLDMSKLMPSTDAEFIPGVSDGSREGTTPVVPPTPTTKYGVNWSVNGSISYTDSIAENQKLSQLPATPTSCSTVSNSFMGWTTAAITDSSDVAPAVMYVALADFPAVTADVTYYAVFAKAESNGPSVPASYTFDAEHQDGWMCSGENKGQYWLLKQGTSIVSPEIDLMGLESIVVNMRTYGGTNNKILNITTEFGDLTTMEATNGSTITEYTWNNNLYIAGTSTLTFTSNYGNNGVGVKSIVINAAGSFSSYSRYITSCIEPIVDNPTDIDQIHHPLSNRKFIHNGHLFIEVDGRIYTITGQKVW